VGGQLKLKQWSYVTIQSSMISY